MIRSRLLTCVALVLLGLAQAPLALAEPRGKVLLIGIDGTRPDALLNANTPNFDALKPGGAYTGNAITGNISFSGPGWSSMLTGVWCDKHGVLSNEFINPNFDEYPSVVSRIETVNPEYRTVSIAHWAAINEQIVEDVADLKITTSTDEEVRDQAISELEKEQTADFLFLHFDDVDYAGHDCCYSPEDLEYREAIEIVDSLIGPVIDALKNRPDFAAENWLIMSSTDHGGGGFIPNQHGADVPEDRAIFVLANAISQSAQGRAGDSARGSTIAKPRCRGCKVERDSSVVQEKPACRGCKVPSGRNRNPGAFLDVSAQITDVAATILNWLNVEIDPGWGLEGQVLPIPGVTRNAPPYQQDRPIAQCALPTQVWDAGGRFFPLPGGKEAWEVLKPPH